MSNIQICRYPLCPVRTHPSDPSEMSTQIFFGELVEVTEQKNQWRKVVNLFDGYEGWVDEKFFIPLQPEAIEFWIENAIPIFNSVVQLEVDGTKMTVSRGARLPKDIRKPFHLNGMAYTINGILEASPENRLKVALAYLNAPYLWGGKSILGIDCSGFTQMILQFEGKMFPRDAYQQAEEGTLVEFNDRQPGDFAFFHNDSGKITHVGMLISPNQIIHAHGNVRIDDFTEEGILNREKKTCSHPLSFVRRC